EGENLRAAARDDLELVASARIDVTQSEKLLRIAGIIVILRGEIRVRQFDTGIRQRSP
ncbi:MAG: hypothetical protein GWN87_08305, partial [Desulfuromonadales bacterium]|nr:hypothetical protein [Desulfuromonadales bacterium]